MGDFEARIGLLILSGVVWPSVGWVLCSIFDIWHVGLAFLIVGSITTVLIYIKSRSQSGSSQNDKVKS